MLVWMDLEMTGLDPKRDAIVEIATLITDDELEMIAEGPDLVIAAPPETLAAMDDVVRQMHVRSGLLEAIATSTVTLDQAATRHDGVSPRARARSKEGATLRQLDRHGQAFFGCVHARDRGLSALPLDRRVNCKRAGQEVVPRSLRPARQRSRGRTAPLTTSRKVSKS